MPSTSVLPHHKPLHTTLGSAALAGDRVVVLDIHPWHDPDDLAALIAAAFLFPALLVVVSDENTRGRAQLARRVLDSIGRHDVPVVRSRDTPGTNRFLPCDNDVDTPVAPVTDLVATTAALHAASGEKLIWVGCGPMTSLAEILTRAPHFADCVEVAWMGGNVDHDQYHTPGRASHNLHVDQHAAGIVTRICHQLRLVLSEHTGVPGLLVTSESPVYRQLGRPGAPEWVQLLWCNFGYWFDYQRSRGRHPGSWMHDVLTLLAAFGSPLIRFEIQPLRIEPDMLLFPDPHGRAFVTTVGADYPAVMAWFTSLLTAPPALPEPAAFSVSAHVQPGGGLHS